MTSFWGEDRRVVLASDFAKTRRSAEEHSQAARWALRGLKVLLERYLAREETTRDLFLKGSDVLRRFLAEECGISAGAQTIRQITERFRGHPIEKELEEVLERCNRVIYDGHHPTQAEKEGIIREVATLIGRLEQVGCPAPGKTAKFTGSAVSP